MEGLLHGVGGVMQRICMVSWGPGRARQLHKQRPTLTAPFSESLLAGFTVHPALGWLPLK